MLYKSFHSMEEWMDLEFISTATQCQISGRRGMDHGSGPFMGKKGGVLLINANKPQSSFQMK